MAVFPFLFDLLIIMEVIESLVDKLQLENDKKAAADPTIRKSLSIVEEFIKTHPVLCYGGTAINNLLPPADRFYHPDRDIPDYDFFSKTPQEHALVLANKLAEAGIANIEVKPGIHLGTFKVFANFEGVADITHLNPALFTRLWKEDVVHDRIHYVTPNFLRMSMYLELSRPRGDVSRWVKVYTRLGLLNKHYPIDCKQDTTSPPVLEETRRSKIQHILETQPVVLLGITASQILAKRTVKWFTPVTILAEPETIAKLAEGHTTKKHVDTDILPPATDILDESGNTILRMYETTACHSYHTAGKIRVASIPTILQFFFAYLYSEATEKDIDQIVCVAQRLVDIANKKSSRRFALLTPVDCLGNQQTLIGMKKEKAELYEKLSSNKSSVEFLRYFFTYNPHETATRRKQKKDALKRTRKGRLTY
jgi:hypothetical protein